MVETTRVANISCRIDMLPANAMVSPWVHVLSTFQGEMKYQL
jgi:hypothetical protein